VLPGEFKHIGLVRGGTVLERKLAVLGLVCGIAGTGILAFFGFPATYFSMRVMGYTTQVYVQALSYLGAVLLGCSFVLQMVALWKKK
jgi:hypothetical protein